MCYVYMFENKLNNKKYIGITNNLKKRFNNHKCEAFTHKNTRPFYRALRKYGWNGFNIRILEKEILKDDICDREIYWIDKHNTYIKNECGYNLTLGGEGSYGWVPSEETRNKISQANKRNQYCKGRILSEETKQRISNSNKGRPNTEKQKKEHSKRMSGINNSRADHTVYSFMHKFTNEIVFKTRVQMKEEFGCSSGQLSLLVRGKIQSHKKWKLNESKSRR